MDIIKISAAVLFLGIVSFASMAAEKKSTGKFKECAAIRMKEIAIKHLEKNDSKFFTQVPKGWTVVSGSGGDGHPKLLICR